MAWSTRATLALALTGATVGPACGQAPRPRVEAAGCVTPARAGLIAESAGGRIVFDDGAERVALTAACGAPAALARATPATRFILLVDDLRAERASGATFVLHLNESDGSLLSGEAGVLGTLNFFGAPRPGQEGQARRVSYDVTKTVRALAAAGRLDRGLVVMLAPSHPPAAGAQLSVGRIQLVAQQGAPGR